MHSNEAPHWLRSVQPVHCTPLPEGLQNGMFVSVGTQCCAAPHTVAGISGLQGPVPLPVELALLATEVDATVVLPTEVDATVVLPAAVEFAAELC
jgi:hypothetical protein